MNRQFLGAFAAASSILLSAGAFPQAAPPRLTVEIDVPDEVTLAKRPGSTGTNVRYARVARSKLKAGRMEEMIAPPVVESLGACRRRPGDTTALRVRVSEGKMKDAIGDSSSRLDGVGKYFNLLESGVVDTGTWSVSVFAALVLELKDDKGAVLASREVTAYDREAAPEGTTAGDFMASQAKVMEARVEKLIRTELVKALPPLLAGVCL